jgi:Zn-dependent protease/predicted transcriptional regulator
LKASIKLGTVWGIELGLHFSWLVIAFLITFSLAEQFKASNPEWGEATIWGVAILTGILFFAALFAHELSHAFVAKLRGLPIHRITLFLLGGMAQIEQEAREPSTEFWMGIAGPIMSAVVGLACLAGAMAAGWRQGATPHTPGTALLVWLGYINLMLAVFNMIPGFPLDGGRVLRAIIWWINHNERSSTRIAARVGQGIAVLFIAVGIFQFFSGRGLGGLWIAFIGWFLMQAASASYFHVQAAAALEGLRVRELMSRDCETVPADLNLRQFVDSMLLRTGRRCFIVIEDDHMVGMVTPHQLKEIPQEEWGRLQLRDVMIPTACLHAVTTDTPASAALDLMGREDVNQVPVLEDGHLAGMLTRAHMLQVLQSRAELLKT